MDLKYINREISQLSTMEATNYISENGLEKLKEFRYLKGLHEERVKKLTLGGVVKQSEQLVLFADWLQYNGKWSTTEQQVKDFLKEQQEQS